MWTAWLPRIVVTLGLAIAGAPAIAWAADDVFFQNLPKGFESAIERCVDDKLCDGIAALNRGPQYFAVTIWDRRISDAFPIERVKGRLLVDAAQFERLIGRYYRWPSDVPKRGRVDISSLPGLGADEQEDMVLALAPERGFTRELTLGGRRIVAPDEFDIPGTAVFGEFRGRLDMASGSQSSNADGARTFFDASFGAQSGLWQFRSNASVSTDDGTSLGYAFVERPILSRALHFRAGLTDTTGCDICFSGEMVGASLATDSLQGLLYSPSDTAYLDVTVGGDIDEIETVVNGRTVRTESAFPGYHTVAVTSLADGLNVIEVYGRNRDTGRVRLLASEQKIAAPSQLAEGRAEWKVEAGWALGRNSGGLGNDPDWERPFVQFARSLGLGNGRQAGSQAIVTADALLASQSLNMPVGGGRLGISAIGSLSDSALGFGAGVTFADRFGPIRVGARAQLCYQCLDADDFTVGHGLDPRLQLSLATALLGWTASASVSYSSDDALGWNAALRRSIYGGNLEIYARQASRSSEAYATDPDSPDFDFGLRFTKTLGGERRGIVAANIEQADGRLRARTSYDRQPAQGEGLFYSASVEGDDLSSYGEGNTYAAGVGRQDDILLASAGASYSESTGATSLSLNAASGFIWADNQFVLTRTARSGGVVASGLTPGSAIVGDTGEIGKVNYLGQSHLNSLTRGEKSRVVFDEGFVGAAAATREAELLAVPGLIYGIGKDYRRQERTYRLVIGPDRTSPTPGLVIFDEQGAEIGYAGYDGIVTLDGRARSLQFNDQDQDCRATISGKEAVEDGLAIVPATCAALSESPGDTEE
jgi:hypothetical protein